MAGASGSLSNINVTPPPGSGATAVYSIIAADADFGFFISTSAKF